MLHGTAGDSGGWQEAPVMLKWEEMEEPLGLSLSGQSQSLRTCCQSVAVAGLVITSDVSPSSVPLLPVTTIKSHSPKRRSIAPRTFKCGAGQLCSEPLGDSPVFPSSSKALPRFQNCHGLANLHRGTVATQPLLPQPLFLHLHKDNNP